MPASRKKKRRGAALESTAVPFTSLGPAMLSSIEEAVVDIPPRNKGYTLGYYSADELRLDCVEHGSYVFKLDHETERLVVSTCHLSRVCVCVCPSLYIACAFSRLTPANTQLLPPHYSLSHRYTSEWDPRVLLR